MNIPLWYFYQLPNWILQHINHIDSLRTHKYMQFSLSWHLCTKSFSHLTKNDVPTYVAVSSVRSQIRFLTWLPPIRSFDWPYYIECFSITNDCKQKSLCFRFIIIIIMITKIVVLLIFTSSVNTFDFIFSFFCIHNTRVSPLYLILAETVCFSSEFRLWEYRDGHCASTGKTHRLSRDWLD